MLGKKLPLFNLFHCFPCFLRFRAFVAETSWQKQTCQKLNVGDGAVRTIISRLRTADLIETSKEGCRLTKKGLEIWCQFEQVFPKRVEIAKNELSESEFSFAFLVKNSGQKVQSGIDQRDAAIIAGARKALVIVFSMAIYYH